MSSARSSASLIGPASRLSLGVEDGQQLFMDGVAVGLTRRFLALVLAAADAGGHLGNWQLAVGATRLKGSVSFHMWDEYGNRSGYTEDSYRRAVSCTHPELARHPGDLARQLIGPLLRGFGTRELYRLALSDPEGPSGEEHG